MDRDESQGNDSDESSLGVIQDASTDADEPSTTAGGANQNPRNRFQLIASLLEMMGYRLVGQPGAEGDDDNDDDNDDENDGDYHPENEDDESEERIGSINYGESNDDDNDNDDDYEDVDDDDDDDDNNNNNNNSSMGLADESGASDSVFSRRTATYPRPCDPRYKSLQQEFIHSVRIGTGLGLDDTRPWQSASHPLDHGDYSCDSLLNEQTKLPFWEAQDCTAAGAMLSAQTGDCTAAHTASLASVPLLGPTKGKAMQPSQNVAMRLRQRELLVSSHARTVGTSRIAFASRYLPSPHRELREFHGRVFCGEYSKDGKVLVTASQDHHIRMFDVEKNHTLAKDIQTHDVGWSIIDVAYSPDQRFVIYSGWSPDISLINVAGNHNIHEALTLVSTIGHFCPFSITFSSDSREILAGCNDYSLYIYDIEEQKTTTTISAHTNDVNATCFADESNQIIYSGSDDGTCKVWDRRSLTSRRPKPEGILHGHGRGITYIDSKGDGRYFLSNGKDSSVKVWDVRKMSNKEPPRMQRYSYAISAPTEDNSILTFRGHTVEDTLIRARFSPAFSTGQRYIVSGSANGEVAFYDICTGKSTAVRAHRRHVRDVSWHPYLPIIASSSWDARVNIWDTDSVLQSSKFMDG